MDTITKQQKVLRSRIAQLADQLFGFELDVATARAQLEALDELPDGVEAKEDERSAYEENLRVAQINVAGATRVKASLEEMLKP
ncbi:MAG TPA: hypothetical protein VFC09_09815 [Candidatus Dormibacteraeota bacterium]|nr:hypothetical protein [Candidatus Dormibacteraeota bacterium]